LPPIAPPKTPAGTVSPRSPSSASKISRDIAHLKDDLLAVYKPHQSQELFAVERIALAQQALLRAARLESGLFITCLDETLDSADQPMLLMSPELAGDGDIEITRAQNRNFLLGEGFHRMVSKSASWSLLLRYQAQSERHYRRAVEESERLQRLRTKPSNEPIVRAQRADHPWVKVPPQEDSVCLCS
jgi:hypothetical protein